MAFVFYDTETSGIQTSFDQILQFAAIKTDADLNIVDKIDIRSRLQPHVIPSPFALRVTGMTIDRLLDHETPSHYTMVQELRNKLLDWSPAVFLGYNSLKFDETLLRQALYQTLHPPYLTQTGGNCRTDVMTLVQMVAKFAPDAIKIPLKSNGKPSFKLDAIAPENGFAHDNAHDALADVEATIHLCRLVRDNAPRFWELAIAHSDKHGVRGFIEKQNPFLLTEFRYGASYSHVAASIGCDAAQPNNHLCVLLQFDPNDYRDMSTDALSAHISKSPKPVRMMKINAAPTIASLDDVPEGHWHGLSRNEIQERHHKLVGDEELKARLHEAVAANSKDFEPSEHVEEQIYDGFATREDEALMAQFHRSSWEDRVGIAEAFADERYRFLGKRMIYFEHPELLGEEHSAEINHHIAERMEEGGKWTSVSKALSDIEKLMETSEGQELELLNSYRAFLIERS